MPNAQCKRITPHYYQAFIPNALLLPPYSSRKPQKSLPTTQSTPLQNVQ
jgi:hypothetical protein